MRLRLLILSLSLLLSCARPPAQVGADNPALPAETVPGAVPHRIFIATTRRAAADPADFLSSQRATRLGLASVVVTVPPAHVAGKIERPRRLPPDPRKEFAVVEPVVYGPDADFIAAIDAELMRRRPEDREVLLFVHGYNNRPSDSILRLAQFAQDTGFRGVPVLFSWASAGKPGLYVYDLNSALVARPLLEDASDLLIRTKARGFDVFAHSMGTLLVTETMVQADLAGQLGESGHLNNIMLAAPDIDLDLFRAQLGQIRNKKGNVFVFVSRDDKALAISRRLSGGVDRVGDATPEELAGLGVTVIDLSAVGDSAGGTHSKYAASPEVVTLIGQSLQQHNFAAEPGPVLLVDVLDGVPVIRDLLP